MTIKNNTVSLQNLLAAVNALPENGTTTSELNFDIVAYTTESELLSDNPKKNTIGVITTVDITLWSFSASQPESPREGMLWIYVGTSSAVEFNALNDNNVQVYPLEASQYIGGSWTAVTALTYQDGVWKTWSIKRFWIENGFVNTAYDQRHESGTTDWYTFGVDGGYLEVTVPANDCSTWMRCSVKPDVTNYSSLVAVCKNQTSGRVTIGMSSSSSVASFVASAVKTSVGAGLITVDISSLSGSYYFGLKVESGEPEAIVQIEDIYII